MYINNKFAPLVCMYVVLINIFVDDAVDIIVCNTTKLYYFINPKHIWKITTKLNKERELERVNIFLSVSKCSSYITTKFEFRREEVPYSAHFEDKFFFNLKNEKQYDMPL